MRIAYYLKRSFPLLLALGGGLLGVAGGALPSAALAAPLTIIAYESPRHSALLVCVAVLLVYGITIAGFLWGFLKTYTYARKRWQAH